MVGRGAERDSRVVPFVVFLEISEMGLFFSDISNCIGSFGWVRCIGSVDFAIVSLTYISVYPDLV